jgi:two-component system sensor histidine kinase VicK
MSATDVQVRFAAEFALFLVALAGLGFSFLRSDLLVVKPLARAAAAVGFAGLATAALLSGALIVDEPTDPVVVALRLMAIALLAAASLRWQPDQRGRELLRIGLVALVLAEVLLSNDQASTLADAARVIGALGVGACLVVASGRIISARIAATGAMILFAVITVIAVSLSAVISDNIEDEALRRYGARAETEAAAAQDVAPGLLPSANLLARGLEAIADPALVNALRRATEPIRSLESTTSERTLLASAIDRLVDELVKDQDPRRGPTLIVDNARRAVVVTPADDPTFVLELSGQPVIANAIANRTSTQDVLVLDGRPVAVAASPFAVDRQQRGLLVRTTKLDSSYLALRAAPIDAEAPGASLALVDRDHTLASDGSSGAVDAETLRTLGRRAIDAGDQLDRTVRDRFYVARPVKSGDGSPVMAVVLSAPRSQEDATREDLFRVLFLVSMGAATAALVLAGVAGERIGGALRRLAGAAAEIEAGNLNARAGVATDDELGQLGRSFDSMAASLGDLTAELRSAARDEAELRARLEAVVGGMGEALIAVDADSHITDFNAAAEELLDLRARDARGRSIGEVVDLRSEDGTTQARRLRRPVLEGWTINGTVRISHGREVPVAVSAGALRGPDGEVNGAVFVLRDERRERELDRMKTEFLSAISHELRTPLTPIKGFGSILETRDLPPAQARGFAKEISSAADQLERVISQLVNFATLVGGRLTLEPEPTAVRPMLDTLLERWKPRVDGSHRIIRKVGARTPKTVLDKAYVLQALDELVDNAVKYSPDGGKIVVDAKVVDGEDGPELEIAVTDEGVGIPSDRIDSVLEDFTQVDASATRRFGGLGLGLALVNRIVRAHDGRLEVTSVQGQGTRVAMRLPVDGPVRRGPR